MFGKLKKKKIEETGFFTYLLLTQDLNKNKKYIFCTLLQILLGLEPVKEFNFSDERRGFPERIELCLNFLWNFTLLNQYYYGRRWKEKHLSILCFCN